MERSLTNKFILDLSRLKIRMVQVVASNLSKNNNYWDAKHVKTKIINIQTVKKPDTAVQMYKQGQLDFASISSTSAIFNSNKKNKDVVTVPEATTSYMTYNETGKVKGLDNFKIRQALNLATDRKGIVEAAVDTG